MSPRDSVDLALFDFDGTVTHGNTWTPFVRLAVSPLRLAGGVAILTPVVIANRLRLITDRQARPMVARVAFTGMSAAAVRELGRRYAAEALPSQIQPRALERIEWHRQRGDQIVVVSASLAVYVRPWCESMQLPCICTELEARGERLTGRYSDGDCSGVEKARRIREHYDLGRYAHVFAYGDSIEDREMLELADRKFYRWTEINHWRDVTSFGHPKRTD